MLMINIFLAFSELISQLDYIGIDIFLLQCVPPDSGETKLGGSNQEAVTLSVSQTWKTQ